MFPLVSARHGAHGLSDACSASPTSSCLSRIHRLRRRSAARSPASSGAGGAMCRRIGSPFTTRRRMCAASTRRPTCSPGMAACGSRGASTGISTRAKSRPRWSAAASAAGGPLRGDRAGFRRLRGALRHRTGTPPRDRRLRALAQPARPLGLVGSRRPVRWPDIRQPPPGRPPRGRGLVRAEQRPRASRQCPGRLGTCAWRRAAGRDRRSRG